MSARKRAEPDVGAAKAAAHPLRLRVFMQLMKEAATVKQIAEALGETPNRLYYHFRVLEEGGLVRVSGTRFVSGIVEKTYEAVPGRYRLPASGIDFGVTGAAVSDAFGELAKAIADDHPSRESSERPLFHWWSGAMSPDKQRELRRRMRRLVRDLGEIEDDEEAGETESRSVIIAFY